MINFKLQQNISNTPERIFTLYGIVLISAQIINLIINFGNLYLSNLEHEQKIILNIKKIILNIKKNKHFTS